MPLTVSYPGVYVQEIPSSAHGVVAASTSATAFVGWFSRGPVGEAVHVTSLNQFQRQFGGLHRKSEASYALSQFFTNGGSDAWLVRLRTSALAATASIPILNPTIDSIVANVDTQLKTALLNANLAWDDVFGQPRPLNAAGEMPPAKGGAGAPPPVLSAAGATLPVPFDVQPPASKNRPKANPNETADDIIKDLGAAGKIATSAGTKTFAASQSLMAAAQAVESAILLIEAKLAQASPTLVTQTWQAAEIATGDAMDAVAAMRLAQTRLLDMVADVEGKGGLPSADVLRAHQDKVTDALEDVRKLLVTAASRAEEALAAGDDATDVAAGPQLIVCAANPGAWGNCLRVFVTQGRKGTFNLTVSEVALVRGKWIAVNTESYIGLTLTEGALKNAVDVIADESALISLKVRGTILPDASIPTPTEGDPSVFSTWTVLSAGLDGEMPTMEDLDPAKAGDPESRAYPDWTAQLQNIAPSVFNILCIPDTINLSSAEAKIVFTAANTLCENTHSIYLFDIPALQTKNLTKLPDWLSSNGIATEDGFSSAAYVPTLVIPDPLAGYRNREVGPSGTMAGVFARTDAQRGVWKAPAGVAAVLRGADVSVKIGDSDNGTLNSAGVNVLRTFPTYGPIAWGARTLAGADLLDSEWKYINVRRLIDYIEQSLFQSLKWVVFEPNNETTWSQIRLEVGGFLNGLFSAGAFNGATPDASFFVRCDATTTTSDDVRRGIVNILVGVAPDKPAEFVVLQIQQMAAQAA